MSLTWEPVNPELHEPRRREVLDAQGQAVPVEDFSYTGANVSSYYFELDAMLELGFKGFADLKTKVNVAFFMLEIACYTNTVLIRGIEDRKLALERKGLAVRVGIANWGIEFTSAFTIAAVAANAQLGLSSTSLEAVISGRDARLIDLARPIAQLTTFSADALKTISECTTRIADFFESEGKTIEPVPLLVAPLDVDEFTWLNTLYSGQFAVESIWRDRSSNESLDKGAARKDIRKYLVPSYVRSVYASLGIRSPGARPDGEQREVAKQMLVAGRY